MKILLSRPPFAPAAAPSCRTGGFTIFELLAALALLGAAAAAILTPLARSDDASRLATAESAIHTFDRTARSLAQTHGQVVLSTDHHGHELLILDSSGTILLRRAMPEGYAISLIVHPLAQHVRYDTLGHALPFAAVIRGRHSSRTFAVSGLTGHVYSAQP
ncbi:MAG: hypothetical protein KF866_10570 [Phycisphaeraceae bacterium]|nr:hypothetical protein [Phycisphaeraceae bacterium]MCW5754944.1 hypothetical protein [Phycisphaeraceae bacterium]